MKRFAIAICCVLALLMPPGCAGPAGGEDSPEMPAAVKVIAITVEAHDFHPLLEASGTLIAPPENCAEVSAQVAGAIDDVPVSVGQAVRKGDPIVHLDVRLLEMELRKLAAVVAECRASLALAESGPLPAEIEGARQEVFSAEAALAVRKAKEAALSKLLEQGDISKIQFDEAFSARQEAEALWKGAQERLRILQAGSREELVAQERARLEVAESELDTQKLSLELCTVRAPLEGVVAALPARAGMYAEKGVGLASIIDSRWLLAQVSLPSVQLHGVTPGDAAALHIAGAPGPAISEGRVERIGAQADAANGRVDLFIHVDNPSGALRPGMACSVELALPGIAGALTVPVAALMEISGSTFLSVVRENQAHRIPVKTGLRTATEVQILQGLSAGDTVVTVGGYALPENCPVILESANHETS